MSLELILVSWQSAHGDSVINPEVGCHYFLPGPQLPSKPNSMIASWPVPNYTRWRQSHKDVNNLSKVVMQHCSSRGRTYDLSITSPMLYP